MEIQGTGLNGLPLYVSKCGSLRSVNKGKVERHEIRCTRCALKYAGR